MNKRPGEKISSDHRSGAAKLTSASISALSSYIRADQSGTTGEFIGNLESVVDEIINAQPYMASVRRRVADAVRVCREFSEDSDSVDFLKKLTGKFLAEKTREQKTMLRDIGSIGKEVIGENQKILTYSASGSVMAVFKAAVDSGIPFSVILSESRPMREGVKFAKELASLHVKTTLVVDIHLPHFIAAANCMIIGADWISETQFSNKIGSHLLVERALTQNIPVYIVAATDKILAQMYYPLTVDKQPPGEILKTSSGFIDIRNRYFEAIPHDNRVKFITEQGILNTEEIIKLAEQTKDRL